MYISGIVSGGLGVMRDGCQIESNTKRTWVFYIYCYSIDYRRICNKVYNYDIYRWSAIGHSNSYHNCGYNEKEIKR